MNKSIVLYLLLAGLLTCFSCTHTKQQPEEEGVDSECWTACNTYINMASASTRWT